MADRFVPGAKAYSSDGRSYIVEEVGEGIVYCSSTGGAETEFPAAALLNEAEWAARSDGRRDLFYTRLKQARPYSASPGKRDPAASAQVMAKIERLSPGILDFTAYTVAMRVKSEEGHQSGADDLSIPKCRAIFDAARPEIAVGLLADTLGMSADALIDAGGLGDNLLRALVEKGIAARSDAYESFLDRPRR